MPTPTYTFTGVPVTHKQPHPDAPQKPEPYLVDEALRRAVNLAIFLRRPLLLEGEAGCGKSRLARAVAYELNLPLYPWHVRSTSRAQDGLYTYDAIRRLHDAHLSRDQRPATDYRTLGPLGKAFTQRDQPAVVLIDEIDKADVDFPNDLLTVLDDPWSFEIPETGEPPIAADYNPDEGRDNRPIVIITSNNEKGTLPAPFLRRCVYHFITFPARNDLLKIVARHGLSASDEVDDAQIGAWADRFATLREDRTLFKKPGTSEFLDWVTALRTFPPAADLDVSPEGKTLPLRGLLLKRRLDWQSYQEPGQS